MWILAGIVIVVVIVVIVLVLQVAFAIQKAEADRKLWEIERRKKVKNAMHTPNLPPKVPP